MYQSLLNVCRNHSWDHEDSCRNNIANPEPYIPHFPPNKKWNGVLVLAEAQNLSNTESTYNGKLLKALKNDDCELLWNRLNLSAADFPNKLIYELPYTHHDIAVSPWKDGTMPFTIDALAELGGDDLSSLLGGRDGMAAFNSVAVSNAVPWSVVLYGNLRNPIVNVNRQRGIYEAISPDAKRAVGFWSDMISAIHNEPELGEVKAIFTFGNVAEVVVRSTGYAVGNIYSLFSTSGANAHLAMQGNSFLADHPDVREHLEGLLASRDYIPNRRTIARNSAAVAIKRFSER